MPTPFAEGDVLDGRYRLVRLLGEGGMGSVWVARQLALRRDVAVKLLRGVGSDTYRARLKDEALALAAVRHPAVVEVYDYGETEEGPYLVLELVQGDPLGEVIAEEGPYDAVEAVALLLPLLDGLEAAHQAGVIHRDIKPANVVVTTSSDGGATLRLLDFGIARLAGTARQTAHGSIIGTPENMAPEQVRGRSADARTDVWAMGVLLYQMIAGANPFSNDDVFATLHRVTEIPPEFPRRARGLDGRLWALLMGALRKAPEDRPASAALFRTQLASWLSARPRLAPRHAKARIAPAGASRPDARGGGSASTLPAEPKAAPGSDSETRSVPPPASPEPAASDRARSPRAPSSQSIDELIRRKLGNS